MAGGHVTHYEGENKDTKNFVSFLKKSEMGFVPFFIFFFGLKQQYIADSTLDMYTLRWRCRSISTMGVGYLGAIAFARKGDVRKSYNLAELGYIKRF